MKNVMNYCINELLQIRKICLIAKYQYETYNRIEQVLLRDIEQKLNKLKKEVKENDR